MDIEVAKLNRLPALEPSEFLQLGDMLEPIVTALSEDMMFRLSCRFGRSDDKFREMAQTPVMRRITRRLIGRDPLSALQQAQRLIIAQN